MHRPWILTGMNKKSMVVSCSRMYPHPESRWGLFVCGYLCVLLLLNQYVVYIFFFGVVSASPNHVIRSGVLRYVGFNW